jgi:hypothetical protein
MKKISRILGMGLLAALASAAHADTPGEEPLIKQLMNASGLDRQIAQIPDLILSGIPPQGTMPAEKYNILLSALKEAFDIERMTLSVSSKLEKNLDAHSMRAALTWLHSDVGIKMTVLEEAASTPQGLQQLQAYAEKLKTKAAPAVRLQLAERLDVVSQATNTVVNMVMATSLGVATAVDAAQVKERRVGAAALKAQLDLQRPALTQAYRPMVTASMLYTYQGVSSADISLYIVFLESKPGRHYQTTANAALIGAISDSSENLGTSLAQALKRLDKHKGI